MYSAARGLLLLLPPPPPLLVMMLYCINIARAAHTESEGRLDFEAQRAAGEGVPSLFQTARRCEAQSEHITLVNALPSGSECGSVYAIKITFNCAFGIVEGCTCTSCTTTTTTTPPGAAASVERLPLHLSHRNATRDPHGRSECSGAVDCTVCNE
jgi:hypothetical protein